MAVRNRLMAFICAVFMIICAVNAQNEEELPNIDPKEECVEFCNAKYGLSLFAFSLDESSACTRGCRFLSIDQLLLKHEYRNEEDGIVVFPSDPSKQNLMKCGEDCNEAYPNEDSEPCIAGCHKQQQILDMEKLLESDNELEGSSWHIATPVLRVRKVMAEVVGQFQVIRTSVMTYFLRDDNTLLAVQSRPEIYVEMLPREQLSPEGDEDQLQHAASDEDGTRGSDQPNDMLFTGGHHSVRRVPLGGSSMSGYGYLVQLLMLLAVVSLALLSLSYGLAIVRHQRRTKHKAANLGVALQQEPLKLVRPEDLTKLSLMEEEDAPPLPYKQNYLVLKSADV